jgi:lactate dehydrogenase-like 2-hydroxyacid dehydrogenase
MIFNKISLIDKTGLQEWAIKELENHTSGDVIVYNDNPNSVSEIIERIGDSECVLVSWQTSLGAEVIAACPNLKYIGMCCSLYEEKSANVDIAFAREKNIIVKGVRDYGDEGLIEFIISDLISLLKGLGKHMWKDYPVELTNRKIGIIGLGATGMMLAERAMAFKMQVYYYNRSRKPEAEKMGLKYLPLNELLQEVEIISCHLPKNSVIMDEEQFAHFGTGKILINTSIGLTFEKSAFTKWIEDNNNYAIFDACGLGVHKEEFKKYDRIITKDIISGWTYEAFARLSRKVIDNIINYSL